MCVGKGFMSLLSPVEQSIFKVKKSLIEEFSNKKASAVVSSVWVRIER